MGSMGDISNPDLYEDMLKYLRENKAWPIDGAQMFKEEDADYDEYAKQRRNKFDFGADSYRTRLEFVRKYGWAVPNEEALKTIEAFVGGDKVLEVGAGAGLWAKILSDMGIDIVATDIFEEGGYGYTQEQAHYNIENMNHLKSLECYSDRNVLMLCWPPYDNSMAHEALMSFKGNKLIYIGEGYGGCTGCDAFHNEVGTSMSSDKWNLVKEVDIPQWWGLHDSVWLFTRS